LHAAVRCRPSRLLWRGSGRVKLAVREGGGIQEAAVRSSLRNQQEVGPMRCGLYWRCWTVVAVLASALAVVSAARAAQPLTPTELAAISGSQQEEFQNCDCGYPKLCTKYATPPGYQCTWVEQTQRCEALVFFMWRECDTVQEGHLCVHDTPYDCSQFRWGPPVPGTHICQMRCWNYVTFKAWGCDD